MKNKSNKYKIVTAFIIGVILTSGVAYAATVLAASDVSYSNSTSKLSSTNVQGAIDEIYNSVTGKNITYHNGNIVGAYMYDARKCPTGDEATCIKTDCPNDTSRNACPSGTIIKYKVNNSTTRIFNVLYGSDSTITMQDSANTVANVKWYSEIDDNTKGPLTALSALESATSGWSNVNTQNYTMGTTEFKINAYTGCDESGSCTTKQYTLGSRSTKARMITVQEATSVGCSDESYSCPKWMGTSGGGYWTMSAHLTSPYYVLRVYAGVGSLRQSLHYDTPYAARAVVVIDK